MRRSGSIDDIDGLRQQAAESHRKGGQGFGVVRQGYVPYVPTTDHTITSNDIATTVAGLDESRAVSTINILQGRLASLLDLHLTLKHIHWNVVGGNFIAVHEFLDPQVDAVREMSDRVAERIATLGGSPRGTPGAIVRVRWWDDYQLDREPTVRHLSALDDVYSGVTRDHRAAQEELAELDPVTEGMIIDQLEHLEQFQWFVRAHLQDATGEVVSGG